MMTRSAAFAAFLLVAACGKRIDGVLYSTEGSPAADREVVAVPARAATKALEKFCREQKARAASADSLREQLDRRSRRLSTEAAAEQSRNGWSRRWRELLGQAEATADSARSVPHEALASSVPVAHELAVARAMTTAAGEFHLTPVPFGRHFLVATADDDWGDAIFVGFLRPSRAELVLDRAFPGCFFLSERG